MNNKTEQIFDLKQINHSIFPENFAYENILLLHFNSSGSSLLKQ
jgi:hypothetical protein